MTLGFNTAKRNTLAMAVVQSLTRFRIFDGTRPASAESDPSGTLLVTINFVIWKAGPSPGTAVLDGTFRNVAAASGTPTWGRFDNGTLSTVRMDATAGEDFTLDAPSLIAGAQVTLTSAVVTQPE